MKIIDEIENEQLKKIDDFNIGDTVNVHVKIKEGDKERIQIFSGTLIARKHGGVRETITVRRLVAGEGVERVFPLHAPTVEKVEVVRHGVVRRAKLYYLRDKVGKEARVKERRLDFVSHKGEASGDAEAPATEEAPAEPAEENEPEVAEVNS